jgi:hypothetical protein
MIYFFCLSLSSNPSSNAILDVSFFLKKCFVLSFVSLLCENICRLVYVMEMVNNDNDVADGPAIVRVNVYIRSISRIDDVTMVSACPCFLMPFLHSTTYILISIFFIFLNSLIFAINSE